MFGSVRRGRAAINIWPGFVDVLATILLAFVFVLMLFVVAQFYLADTLSGRNAALERLRGQVEELARTLSLERDTRGRLEEQISSLYEELHSTLSERDELRSQLRMTREQMAELEKTLAEAEREVTLSEEQIELKLREIASLQADISALRTLRDELEARVGELAGQLDSTRETLQAERDRRKALQAELADAEELTRLRQETIDEKDIRIERLVAQVEEQDAALAEQARLTASARDQVETLRRQIRELQEQIASLSEALGISRDTVASQKEEIERLGERLNLALAQKVRELSRYRSEFFGRLREVLGNIDEIRIVGDRFMFQSELFFESGSAQIGEEGQAKLDRLAEVLQEIARRIPEDIDWVLQVEGHTDRRPISTERFPSNWELSTARATNIVHYLIEQGVDPKHLAAAGYGEYQPVDPRNTPEAYRRNRRIELKLTNR